MYIGIRRYKVRHASRDKLIATVKNFLPVVESLPGFKYYHVYDWPGDFVTVINAFDVAESVERSHEKALDWVYKHGGNLVDGRPEVSSCTALISVES